MLKESEAENSAGKRKKVFVYLLGMKFKVFNFTSFLSWTGIVFCVLSMIGSLALLTLPTDVEPWLDYIKNNPFNVYRHNDDHFPEMMTTTEYYPYLYFHKGNYQMEEGRVKISIDVCLYRF